MLVGGLLVTVITSFAMTGTSGLSDPRTWVVVRLLLTHPHLAIITLLGAGGLTLFAYLAHRDQKQRDQRRQLAHDEALEKLGKVHFSIDRLESIFNPSMQPAASTPPSIWSLPYSRNPFFSGQEPLLKTIYEHFMIAHVTKQALSGLGGVGKTQIAIEYAYRHREAYRFVWWIRAASRDTIITDFVSVAESLRLPEWYIHDQRQIIGAVKQWFTHHTEWLLIFDNVDNVNMISDFLPTGDSGHVLLTTRLQSVGRIAYTLAVENMEIEEGTLLLLRRARLIELNSIFIQTSLREQAQAIVQKMDGLPLALEQAGAYIEETGCSLIHYLALYQERQIDILKWQSAATTQYLYTVDTAWSLSFQRVQESSAAAADLLRLCAFLYPDTIPVSMIKQGASELGRILQSVAQDEFALDKAIGELRRYSLLKRDVEKEVLNIHRLVQIVIRNGMNQKMQKVWAERAIRLVNHAFPDPQQLTDWPKCQTYMPHVYYCLDIIEQQKLLFPEVAKLLFRAGSFLREQAHYNSAERLIRQALDICKQLLGPNHPDVACGLNTLGWLYFTQQEGKAKQAESLYRRAIAIYELTPGSNRPEVARCYNDLAVLYGYRGNYEQAEQILQKALTIREQFFGPDHPDVAESLYGWSRISFYLGNYAQAEQLLQRAIAICKGVPGNQQAHHISGCLGFLSLVYQEQGQYQQAELCLQQSLVLYKEIFGDDHHYWTLLAMTRLGVLYREKGEYERAETLLLRVVDLYERSVVSNTQEKGSAIKELAILYYQQGKSEQAEPILQRALAVFQPQLDIELHAQETWPILFSEVVECLNTLALLYQYQGKHEIAEQYYCRALELIEKGWSSNDILKVKREREVAKIQAHTDANQAKSREIYPRDELS
ncbi:tetratricopeptide repeat protein [Dictyobacter formicarum]|uniref:Tetratricopeptide repeat protein n=1 Tax=Dictyobacter formicarum TaxID=2778368 RepID=A0ABQ3VQC3_9CHLR|nr:tetratricopeptide repeat protein [Dictyobacter formicarum]